MFSLAIHLSPAAIDEIKTDLREALPHVKSSHRCEALARGLGFRTYAAALTQASGLAKANGVAFSDYLAEHGFQIDPPPLYEAVGRCAVRRVLEKIPDLSVNGMGVVRERTSDRTWESPSETRARHELSRARLVDDGVEEFLRSLALLERIQPTKNVRSNTDSYELKHIAEKYRCTYPEGQELGPDYVSNGALIAAAVHAGFSYRTYSYGSGRLLPNVSFNMSINSLKAIIKIVSN
jgi:hypothetical protein